MVIAIVCQRFCKHVFGETCDLYDLYAEVSGYPKIQSWSDFDELSAFRKQILVRKYIHNKESMCG